MDCQFIALLYTLAVFLEKKSTHVLLKTREHTYMESLMLSPTSPNLHLITVLAFPEMES